MIPLMARFLLDLEENEAKQESEAVVSRFIDELTDQQTIFQLFRPREEIQFRGYKAAEPSICTKQFHDLLSSQVNDRIRNPETEATDPDGPAVPGAINLLNALKNPGIQLSLASGKYHNFATQEAELLRIDQYFNLDVNGARDNYKDFSKVKLVTKFL